jgi:hypothetical protein
MSGEGCEGREWCTLFYFFQNKKRVHHSACTYPMHMYMYTCEGGDVCVCVFACVCVCESVWVQGSGFRFSV